MTFYTLKQNGYEIQNILNSFGKWALELEDLKNNMSSSNINIAIKIIDESEKEYNINNISHSAIYYIPTNIINTNILQPSCPSMYSDYIYLIHLQHNIQKSQYLITQNIDNKIICYYRNTDSEGNFNSFQSYDDVFEEKIQQIENKLKITCWDE